MRHIFFLVCLILLMSMLSFTGCENITAQITANEILSQSKVSDNLRLVSVTKMDDNDVIYGYIDTSYQTEVYVCKNLKTNMVSISTNKDSN